MPPKMKLIKKRPRNEDDDEEEEKTTESKKKQTLPPSDDFMCTQCYRKFKTASKYQKHCDSIKTKKCRRPDLNFRCTVCKEDAIYTEEGKIGMRCNTHKTIDDLIFIKSCTKCHKSLEITSYRRSKTYTFKNSRHSECISCYNKNKSSAKNKRLAMRGPDFVPTITEKKCACCELKHPVDEFGICKPSADGVMSTCRACRVLYTMDKKEFIDNLKRDQECENCGYNADIRALEFAHKNREEKARTKTGNPLCISELSITRIKSELPKTKLLCKFCHNIETHQETNADMQSRSGTLSDDQLYQQSGRQEANKYVTQRKFDVGACKTCDRKVEPGLERGFNWSHLDYSTKCQPVSRLVSRWSSKDTLDAAMDKCELLCSTCFAIKLREKIGVGWRCRDTSMGKTA